MRVSSCAPTGDRYTLCQVTDLTNQTHYVTPNQAEPQPSAVGRGQLTPLAGSKVNKRFDGEPPRLPIFSIRIREYRGLLRYRGNGGGRLFPMLGYAYLCISHCLFSGRLLHLPALSPLYVDGLFIARVCVRMRNTRLVRMKYNATTKRGSTAEHYHEVLVDDLLIRLDEAGSLSVYKKLEQVKPVLREIAEEEKLPYDAGWNTRRLGRMLLPRLGDSAGLYKGKYFFRQLSSGAIDGFERVEDVPKELSRVAGALGIQVDDALELEVMAERIMAHQLSHSLLQTLEEDIRAFLSQDGGAIIRKLYNEQAFQLQLSIYLINSGHYKDVQVEYLVETSSLGSAGGTEVSGSQESYYVDVVVENEEGWYALLELKFPLMSLSSIHTPRFGERELSANGKDPQGANLVRYAFWKDVLRIEQIMCSYKHVVGGVAFLLTNLKGYWEQPKPNNQYQYRLFSLIPGQVYTPQRYWQGKDSDQDIDKKKYPNFDLKRNYVVDWWKEILLCEDEQGTTFRPCIVRIY